MSESTVREGSVILETDDISGYIELRFQSRSLHRLLSEAAEKDRLQVVHDALELGAEMLERVRYQGEMAQLKDAVDELDGQSRQIVEKMTENAKSVVTDTVERLSEKLSSDDGPLASILKSFDLEADDNVIDTFRRLVGATITDATDRAVTRLADSTVTEMTKLRSSISALDRVAAAETARLEESEKGTAKGRAHERDVERLLGEILVVTQDSMENKSEEYGLSNSKVGDKLITVRSGTMTSYIVTEDKKTATRYTEQKAREILDNAIVNRCANVGMLVVDDESKVPGGQIYRLIDNDKVVVVADHLALRLVYPLMRARSLEIAQSNVTVDDEEAKEKLRVIRSSVNGLKEAAADFRKLKTAHTKAKGGVEDAIASAKAIEEKLLARVAEITRELEEVLGSGEPATAETIAA